jgi:hypothetical protein
MMLELTSGNWRIAASPQGTSATLKERAVWLCELANYSRMGPLILIDELCPRMQPV